MQKSLQVLFGLLLILILAYVAFLDVSTKIKDDLLTKTKVMYSENNVRNVSANIKGEGLSLSRTLVLTGTAISEVERVRIVTLTKNIEGICSIDNQITLYPVVHKAPEVPLVPKVVTVIKVPLVKVSTQPIVAKNIPKEPVPIANKTENKIVVMPILATKMTTKIPAVPTPVRAIDAPDVIKIKKIKLEGVK